MQGQSPGGAPTDALSRAENGPRVTRRLSRRTIWLTTQGSSRQHFARTFVVGMTVLALIAPGLGASAYAGNLLAGITRAGPVPAPAVAQASLEPTFAGRNQLGAVTPAAQSSATPVLSTVDLGTGDVSRGVAVYQQGLHPDAVAVDPASGDVYVANAGTGTVSVISQLTNHVVKYIKVGNDPTSVTLNSESQTVVTSKVNKTNGYWITAKVTNDLLYVTNHGANTITVINGSTNTVLSTNQACGTGPVASGYGAGGLWVADKSNNSISAFGTPEQDGAGASLAFQPSWAPCGVDETSLTGGLGGIPAPDAVLIHYPYSGPPSPGKTPLVLVSESGAAEIRTYCYFPVLGIEGGALVAGVTLIDCGAFGVGSDPQGLAWDSTTNLYYVANAGSNTVTAASVGPGGAGQEKTMATIPVGSAPEAIAYDPANQDLYVVNNGSDNVTVISGATHHPIGSVHVGNGPDAIAYDAANGDLYVCNWGSDNVSIFNASSFLHPHSLLDGLVPVNLVWDAASGSVYVGMSDSSAVSLFTPSNDTVSAAFTIQGWKDPGPPSLAFDATDGIIFAAQPSSGGVTAFNSSGSPAGGSSSTFFATGEGPDAVVFNPVDSRVYVANSGSDTVTQLSLDPTSVELPVGQGPDALAVDLANGKVFVANALSDNVTVLGATPTGGMGPIASIPVGAMPDAAVYDPANGFVYVANALSDDVSVIDGATDRVIASIPAGSDPVALAFDPANGYLYAADYASGNISLLNTSTQAGGGSVPVGPNPSAIAVDPANGYLYVSEAGDGALAVVSPAVFQVTFTESGLPAGSTWSVVVGGLALSSSTGSVGLSRANGTYPYSVAPVPSNPGRGFAWEAGSGAGSLTVSGGPTRVDIAFVRVYLVPVVFESLRLPAGDTWSVTVGGTTTSNTTVASGSSPPSTGTITVYAPNGTLNFSVRSPPGVGIASITGRGIISLTSGTVTGPTTWRVSFGAWTPLTFAVSPFPPFKGYSGASWSVSLLPAVQRGGPLAESASSNGTGSSATNSSRVGFLVPAGASYKFAIVGPGPEYRMSPSHGSVHLQRDPGPNGKTIRVKLALQTSKVAVKESGAPRGATWSITITDGTSSAFHYPFSETARGPRGLNLRLPTGTYTYNASVPNSTTPTVSGVLQVVYPTAPAPTRVAFGTPSSVAGCFFFTNNGTQVGGQVCNVNANDFYVGLAPTPAGVCANQFTLAGSDDGPSIACASSADGLEVSWAGSGSGTVIGACTWLNGSVPLDSCPVPTPSPTGFVLAAEISYVGWTVNGTFVGIGLAAPPGANGVEFVA